MRSTSIRFACAFAALCAVFAHRTIASGAPNGGGGVDGPLTNNVITYDGTDSAVVNTYLGADTFYNAGIFGQNTISANIEAGAIWGGPDGHQALTLSTFSYVGDGALGEVDRHATWVGSVLGGFNYNDYIANGNNSYLDLGIAPLTFLASGSIATSWIPDGAGPGYSTSFTTSQGAIYSTFNRFTNTNTAVNPTINASYPFLGIPGAFVEFNGTANVINASWGFGDSTGTDDVTKTIDGFARKFPSTTIVVAAGNAAGFPDPSNSVTGPGSGYNIITVGATQTSATVSDFNQVASFSGRGPQDYNDPVHGTVPGVRAAVDIVAPGTTLVAAFYGGQTGGNGPNPEPDIPDNNLYSYPLAGTSFAAPIVSGAASLLNSASITTGMAEESRDSRVIKAVLMNSATKLPGWDNGQHFDVSAGHVITTQSLDWAQGAGQVNFTAAYHQYLDGTQDVPGNGGGSVAKAGWDRGAVTLGQFNDYVIDTLLHGGDLMDVTLAWFRDRGIDEDNQVGTDDGQANLDVQIWDSTFSNLLASSESVYNTSEELHFALPGDGNYGIRVLYAGQLFGDPLEETYGLAWNDVAAVPEPSGIVLAGLGLAAIFFGKFTVQRQGSRRSAA